MALDRVKSVNSHFQVSMAKERGVKSWDGQVQHKMIRPYLDFMSQGVDV